MAERKHQPISVHHVIIIVATLLLVLMLGMFVEKHLVNNSIGVDEIEIKNNTDRISYYLDRLLSDIPIGPFAARIALIHSTTNNRVSSPHAQAEFLRWDIVASRTRDGSSLPLTHDQPLTSWLDYIDTLSAGECAAMFTKNLTQVAAREHLLGDLEINAFLVCPIEGPDKTLLGAVFLNWKQTPDSADDMAPFTPRLQRAANQIARVVRESEK
jgi:hypothetical protein